MMSVEYGQLYSIKCRSENGMVVAEVVLDAGDPAKLDGLLVPLLLALDHQVRPPYAFDLDLRFVVRLGIELGHAGVFVLGGGAVEP